MLDSTAMSLEEKLRSILMADDTGKGPIGQCGAWPRWAEDIYLTETEADLRDWGLVYGMAFAIAREQDPWESVESVAKRALEPAQRAYRQWGGHIAQPERAEVTPAEVVA